MLPSIFECTEYTDRQWPAYHPGTAYGTPDNTVVYWFARTPRGKVSKFWCSLTLSGGLSASDMRRRIVRHFLRGRPDLPKGYRWSRTYLYSGKDPYSR